MAREDYSGVPDAVASLEAPNDYQREEASPASFGAPAAAGLSAAGEGALSLADALNESKILGASNQLADFASDQQQTFRSLQGQNAIDAFPQYKQDLEDKQSEIAATMPTMAARNTFANNSRRFVQGALEDAGSHVAGQTVKLQDETAQGQLVATKNFAVSNRNQPGVLPQSISTLAAQTADYMYRIKGVRDPDAIHAAVQTQVGSLVSDTVLASMNEGTTIPEQQQALKNARDIYNQATKSTVPGSPNVPMLTAQDVDKLGQTLNYREFTLQQRADREQEKASVNMRVSLSNQMDNATSMIDHGVQFKGNLPNDGQIDAAYPNQPERALLVKAQRDDLQNVNYYLGVVPMATPQQIMTLREQAAPDPNKPDTYAHQARVSAALDHALDVRNKALAADPASYVISSSPDVQHAWNAAQADPSQFSNYAHQVQVSLGTIGLPDGQQSLLPAPIAKSLVQKVEASPEAAPQQMQQMQKQYGQYWPQVWRDLVQRGGMSRDYQSVGIIDPGNAALLARALAEPSKSAEKSGGMTVSQLVSDKDRGVVLHSISSNQDLQLLKNSLGRSGLSDSQVKAVESSTINLAFAHMAYKGEAAPAAIAAAIKAFTGQYNFSAPGNPRIPSDKYDAVMQNANTMLHGLTAGHLALPGTATPAAVSAAILGQESGNNPNAPPSVTGARGPGQIQPDTFKHYARPGESIDNSADNRAVSDRAVRDYYQRYGGDTARVSVAYFSGPGNVAPPGSPHAWVADRHDPTGKTTSSYVADMQKRLGGGIFNQLGGPKGDDYVRSIQAAPSWITSPNADALWLMDHNNRVVRTADGAPLSVPFNSPPIPRAKAQDQGFLARLGNAFAQHQR